METESWKAPNAGQGSQTLLIEKQLQSFKRGSGLTSKDSFESKGLPMEGMAGGIRDPAAAGSEGRCPLGLERSD